MAVGQAVLVGTLDVGALTVLELRMEQREVRRSAEHAGSLRDVLALQALFGSTGHDLATVAQLALLHRCSESRAGQLLTAARLLVTLPGALEALESGLLTVEQSQLVVAQLLPLPGDVALTVWERLRDRLIADEDAGVVRPPARLRPLLARWVIEADADAATCRRRQARATRPGWTTGAVRTGWSTCSRPGCPAWTRRRVCPGSGLAPSRSGSVMTGRPAGGGWTRWSI